MKLKPAGSSLFVDGHPAELEPDGILLLAFGRHQLSLRCSTCAPAEKDEDINVAGGERREIELTLAPAPLPSATDTSGGTGTGSGAAAGGTIGIVSPPGGGADASAERGNAHIWLAGLAGAAALGAGGSALWWREEQQEKDRCAAAGDLCTNAGAVDDRRKVAIGATIGLGAAALISAAFAAVMWTRPEKSDSSSNNVACAIGKDSISCAFRF